MKKKIMAVFGTRPEAVKMVPVLFELSKYPDHFETITVITAQHRQMLDQILESFGISSDHDLNIMTANQTLDDVLIKSHSGVGQLLEKHRPDLVLVQGDTTTTMATAMAVYHHRIKLGHIEAGLRSFDKLNPFPEEINRIITDSIADFAFAPTEVSKKNLLRTGVEPGRIFVTGNTVVDALMQITKQDYDFQNPVLRSVNFYENKVILVTTHRRENYISGETQNIVEAVNSLLDRHPELKIILPLHPNPNVRKIIATHLKKTDQIVVCEPLSYKDMVKILNNCFLVLTDSGGIQEEAPTFGKPVLVLRDVTERPEGVTAGVAKIVGTSRDRIVDEVERLFDANEYAKMSGSKNPYGDGRASERIVSILRENL